MRRVAEWTTTTLLAFALYLVLSAFSGRWGLWAPDELLADGTIPEKVWRVYVAG